MLPMIHRFCKDGNAIIIYFMAVAIKQDTPSGKYLHQCACDVIGLMDLRAKPIDVDVGNQVGGEETLQPGESPQLLTQLQFIDAFAQSFYNNWFTLACQPDPKFGASSQGHTSRLWVERCYIMKQQLLRLMEVDGLKRDPSFAKYMKALDGMPVLGSIEAGGRELFSKMETVFFEEFTASFADHIESVWRSNEILLYLLGGNPRLAKLTASWLFSFEENSGADE